MPVTDIRKVLKWAGRNIYCNEDAVREFFSCMPEILADLKEERDRAEREMAEGICDPRTDPDGKRIEDKDIIGMRKARNKELTAAAKEAKAKYNSFLKRISKLEILRDMYMDWDS
jgi:hypothetical protein